MSKNVAVFVDVANIFYAAKAAGVDIDYVTLLKASSAGRDLVRAYAYTGLDPENENQRNFHDFLRRHGYKVVSKDIRKYGDGKVKANLDIELVVDMMKTARNLDIAIVVSGDGDFAPAIRAVQEMGVRVEVVSFRGNTSSDLIDVADQFSDITQIAKVEKSSSRSGRRVATDEEDLSMTEVPEKQSEGAGDGRRRGRGTRARAGEGRTSRARAAAAPEPVAGEGALVALPGEKLARASRRGKSEVQEASPEVAVEPDGEPQELEAEGAGGELGEAQGGEDGRHRRRRRRGGRGRGRGRGREGEVAVESEEARGEGLPELEPLPAPRRQASSFGSVWDSQLGKVPAAAAGTGGGPLAEDEEDLEEPSIPEYLLAERRQREGGAASRRPGRSGRGRGGAYAAALERERFGGGRGSTPSRFAEPVQRHRDAGREAVGRGGSFGRGFDRAEPRGTSSEPWSEVPPEIEAMLRAQLATGGGRQGRPVQPAATRDAGRAAPAAATEAEAPASTEAKARAPRARRATGPRAGAGKASEAAVEAAEAAPSKPAARARRGSSKAAATGAPGEAAGTPTTAGAAPKRARRAKPAAAASAEAAEEAAPAPKARTSRRKTAAD